MGRFRVVLRSNLYVGVRIAAGVLAFIALLAPLQIPAQCQPADSAKANPSVTQKTPPGTPQFYDEPQFTVAGVADATNLGGHGSDTVVRTKEALAKDTVHLSKQGAPNSVAGTSPEAIPDLERAVRQNPRDYRAAHALSLAYVNAGKYEDARTQTRALLLRRDLALSDQAELHHLLGDVEEKLKNPLQAVREYQRATELEPSEPNLFDWGTELLAHRAPEAAIEVLAKGNRLFPRSVRMLVGLGVAWHARGAYDQAADCLCKASDLDPSDPTAYLFLGKMQNAATIQAEGIVERLERFSRIHPENALANYYYAAALWKQTQGTADAAMAAQVELLLQKAVHLDPKLGVAYVQLGIVYSDQGDLPKAVSAYQQAIEASPQLEEPHYRLAQAYRRTGEKAKAGHELQRYEELSKKATQEAELERHEIQQFVVALRDSKPAPEDKL